MNPELSGIIPGGMTGTIELDRLGVRCIVGIHPFERVQEQDVFLDIARDRRHAAAA